MSTFKFNNEEFNSLIPTSNLFNTTLNKGKYLFISAENIPYGDEDKSFTSFTYRHEDSKRLVKFTNFDLHRLKLNADTSILEGIASEVIEGSEIELGDIEISKELPTPIKERVYPVYAYAGFAQYKLDKASDDESISRNAKATCLATKKIKPDFWTRTFVVSSNPLKVVTT